MVCGCLVRSHNPIEMVNMDGIAHSIQEQRACDKGQTYVLGEDDTTLLWSDRTVKSFFDSVLKRLPWVLMILHQNPTYEGGDTPPRGLQITLDP